ncbi:hypothetical protein ACOSQ2_031254 [Xanthoceras sorbifolium]
MVSLIKFWLCLFLAFILFSSFEARLLDPMFLKNGNRAHKRIVKEVSKTSMEKQTIIERHFKSREFSSDDNRVLMESAEKMFKESVQRQEALGRFFESKRVSPGGPDPHHHKL